MDPQPETPVSNHTHLWGQHKLWDIPGPTANFFRKISGQSPALGPPGPYSQRSQGPDAPISDIALLQDPLDLSTPISGLTLASSDMIDYIDVIDIYGIFHPKAAEYTLFSKCT